MDQFIPIYVCCHDTCQLPNNELLVPIQAGRKTAAYKLSMQGDDSGINLSNRNVNYCELSALYWIWHNTRHKCFGLCHYRRFFNLRDERQELDSFDNFTVLSGHSNIIINQLMKEYDLILPYPKTKNNGCCLYQLYSSAHEIDDLDLALKIIRDVYPEMWTATEEVIFHQPLAYYKNMMIAHRDFADAYCNWLFDVLSRLDSLIYSQLSQRNSYQQRVYGFLAERLFNVFLEYYRRRNSLRIKEVPLLFYPQTPANNEPLCQNVAGI